MKTKDYIKVKLVEDIEKLTTQKSFCIKRTSDHSVMVEGIKISFNIINCQAVAAYQDQGIVHFRSSDLRDTVFKEILKGSVTLFGLNTISGNVYTIDSSIYSQLIGSGIFRSDMTDETSKFIDQSFSEVEGILNSISEINSNKTNVNWYLTKNKQIQTEITELQQKINKNNVTAVELTKQVNNFKISDIVTPYDVNQKSHILQKIWLKSDTDSLNLKESIKQQEFNPHYVNKLGQGLIHLSIAQNDIALFKLLIDKKLDFNFIHNKKSLFDLVLAAKNHEFIQIMLNSCNIENFTMAVVVKTLSGEAHDLAELFKIKPEFSSIKYKDTSLLQLAIKAKKYQAAEEIIKANNSTLSQLNAEGLSALELALTSNNIKGIELLQKYNADTLADNQGDTLIHRAIAKGNIDAVKILLNNKPSLIDCQNSKNGQSLLHMAIYCNQIESVKILLELKPELINTIDNEGNSLLHLSCRYGQKSLIEYLLLHHSFLLNKQNNLEQTALHVLLQNTTLTEEVKLEFAELILSHNPNILLADFQHHSINDLVIESHPMILAKCYEYELIGGAKAINENLS